MSCPEQLSAADRNSNAAGGKKPIPPDDKRAYSIRAFCDAYDVGRTFSYQQISLGLLEAKKAGGRTLISVEEAARWYAALPRTSPRLVRRHAQNRPVFVSHALEETKR